MLLKIIKSITVDTQFLLQNPSIQLKTIFNDDTSFGSFKLDEKILEVILENIESSLITLLDRNIRNISLKKRLNLSEQTILAVNDVLQIN